jgi:hypothetical protein
MNLTLKSTIPLLYFSIKLARKSLSFSIRFVVILRVPSVKFQVNPNQSNFCTGVHIQFSSAIWKPMISKETFGECRFWLDHVDSLNEIGSQLCQLTYNETQDFHVFCDASEIGFGGHLTIGSEDEPVEIYGSWSREEQAQSSTWRELDAVNRVLRNVINKLNGKFVRVYTDNKNVTHIIRD